MHFKVGKFTTITLTVVASTMVFVNAAILPRKDLAQLSVVFFDNVNLTGAAFSPDSLIETVCSTLPADWLDRPQSVLMGPGYSCTFFEFEGCDGCGTTLTGTSMSLPDPSLFNNIESFSCNKLLPGGCPSTNGLKRRTTSSFAK